MNLSGSCGKQVISYELSEIFLGRKQDIFRGYGCAVSEEKSHKKTNHGNGG